MMQLNTMEDLNEFLENRNFSFSDISEIVYYLLLRRFEFDYSVIFKLRKIQEKKIIKEINYPHAKKLIDEEIKFEKDLKNRKLKERNLSRNSILGVSDNCNLNWPLCIYDKFFKMNVINYFYFRTSEKIEIIEDYFYSEKIKTKISKEKLSNVCIYNQEEIEQDKIDVNISKNLKDKYGTQIKINLDKNLNKNNSIKNEEDIFKKNEFNFPYHYNKNLGKKNILNCKNIQINNVENNFPKEKIKNDSNSSTRKKNPENIIIIETQKSSIENEELFELDNDCIFSLHEEDYESQSYTSISSEEREISDKRDSNFLNKHEDENYINNKHEVQKVVTNKNEKKIMIYKSLVINRRKHYCQILNKKKEQNLNSIYSNKNKNNLDTINIGKNKFIIF